VSGVFQINNGGILTVDRLPLPKEVPMAFRVLPEYILEDIVDYLHFIVQTSPDKFDLSGKTELLIFVLTFLNSTWYIKNPFLKSKINDASYAHPCVCCRR
jgi:ubiquitin conjugation factor E4 B